MNGWWNAVIFSVVFLAIIFSLLGALYGWQWLAVQRLRARWASEGRRLRFGPAGAALSLARPLSGNVRTIAYGAVALVDDRLLIRGTLGRYEIAIPLDQIHWVGRRAASLTPQPAPKPYLVQVTCTAPDGWQGFTFRLREWQAFADALARATGLPVPTLGHTLKDPLPTQAMRMAQNIYGQWHADFTAPLHLAPDRLVFAWQQMIPYHTIAQLDLYDRDSGLLDALNPFTQDLLCITHAAPDGHSFQVTGFQLSGARQWGKRIAERSGVPLTVHDGRKKKTG